MRNILTILAILFCISAKSQTFNRHTLYDTAQYGWHMVADVLPKYDTLVIPAGSPIRVVKVGDTYYEITKPELKKVEQIISFPIIKQNWGGLSSTEGILLTN